MKLILKYLKKCAHMQKFILTIKRWRSFKIPPHSNFVLVKLIYALGVDQFCSLKYSRNLENLN